MNRKDCGFKERIEGGAEANAAATGSRSRLLSSSQGNQNQLTCIFTHGNQMTSSVTGDDVVVNKKNRRVKSDLQSVVIMQHHDHH